MGTLPVGWPGYISGNAEVAFHEGTGADCEVVWSISPCPPHGTGESQAKAAVVCAAAQQEFLSSFFAMDVDEGY